MAGYWPPLEDRLWARVAIARDDECWNWTGHLNCGYGTIFGNGRTYKVHRLAYELLVGPIPEGLVLDHLCRNTACVNPAHLEPVTIYENTRRGLQPERVAQHYAEKRAQTHCKRGHELSGDNLYLGQPGKRACRTCRREATRRSDEKRKAS
jgi:hypothetical protein